MQPRKHEDAKKSTKKKSLVLFRVRLRVLRVCVVPAALAAGCGGRARQGDLRPIANQNVLLITIDTLRADALSSYGGPASTPALDRLAADGVRFTFAHAHA